LKSRLYYSAPAATCFWPDWHIITQYILVQISTMKPRTSRSFYCRRCTTRFAT